MERIMLSKMNSEVSNMYTSGFNKLEGTVQDLKEKQAQQFVERMRLESTEFQKNKRRDIIEKLQKI